MAVIRWQGQLVPDNDFLDVANWLGGVVPVVNDDVVYDGEGAYAQQDCTVNCDPAFGLNSATVGPGYSGALGNAAAGTKFAPDSIDTFIYNGSGDLYLDSIVTDGRFRAEGSAGTIELDGFITDLVIFKATATLIAGCNVTRTFLHYLTTTSSDASLTVTAGAILGDVTIYGGFLTNAVNIGNLTVEGGQVTHTAGDINLLYETGGTVLYEADAATSTLAQAVIRGGLFDATNDPLPKVIDSMTLWRPGTADLRNKMNNITITNPVINHGGTLRTDEGSTITIA